MINVRGLHCADVLAALWNNQVKTGGAWRLALKWRLNKRYAVTSQQVEDAMMRSGRGINLGCPFSVELCAQLGINPREVDPWHTKHVLDGGAYDGKNGAGRAEQVIDRLRQHESVARFLP